MMATNIISFADKEIEFHQRLRTILCLLKRKYSSSRHRWLIRHLTNFGPFNQFDRPPSSKEIFAILGLIVLSKKVLEPLMKSIL
jgi:hypothetical protein